MRSCGRPLARAVKHAQHFDGGLTDTIDDEKGQAGDRKLPRIGHGALATGEGKLGQAVRGGFDVVDARKRRKCPKKMLTTKIPVIPTYGSANRM